MSPPSPAARARPELCGLGLRRENTGAFVEGSPRVAWVEAITDNFIAAGGKSAAVLERVRRDFPIALHGVGLSIGDAGPMNAAYLAGLADLVRRTAPRLVSEHLCWGSHHGCHAHDLLPLPHTEGALAHVVERVRRVQDLLGRQIALENVSTYARFLADTMGEAEFLARVAEGADCLILLDVNNVVVNAYNHGLDAGAFLAALPRERVAEIHIAGHTDCGDHLLDTHVGPVPEGVWDLYRAAIARFGPVPTLLEWDQEVPEMPVLEAEVARAEREAQSALALRRATA